MQLVSSPRLSARGPAATRTSAAQGAGYKNPNQPVLSHNLPQGAVVHAVQPNGRHAPHHGPKGSKCFCVLDTVAGKHFKVLLHSGAVAVPDFQTRPNPLQITPPT